MQRARCRLHKSLIRSIGRRVPATPGRCDQHTPRRHVAPTPLQRDSVGWLPATHPPMLAPVPFVGRTPRPVALSPRTPTRRRSPRVALALLLVPLAAPLLGACASRTGPDRGREIPPRPTTDLRLPPEDGLLLSVLSTSVRTPWSAQDAPTRARFDVAAWERSRAELEGRADQITYASGGLRVGAFLARPRVTTGRRLPVVIVCRDGIGEAGLAPDALLVELDAWTREGYVAIATAYRGNRLSQGEDSPGAADDVLGLLPLVRELAYADPGRVFVLGRGLGGQRAVGALAATDAVRAAAIVGAELAPATDVTGIDEPLLVVHGALDLHTPLPRAEALIDALATAGTEHQLFVIEDGDHTLHAHSPEIDARVAEWFAAHGGRSLVN